MAKPPINVVLISTYELGHQPFGLASPAAWLKRAGARVTCLDLAVQGIPEESIAAAGLIAFYLPMHTATKIATALVPRIRRINPEAHLCFYGLYAPMNEIFLRKLGANTILGGEFEEGLSALYESLCSALKRPPQFDPPLISLSTQEILVPERIGLQPLSTYAYLNSTDGSRHTAGYTEASRGCKHLCRHCPIVPVYQGVFRTVQSEIVIEDIRTQIETGRGISHLGTQIFLTVLATSFLSSRRCAEPTEGQILPEFV